MDNWDKLESLQADIHEQNIIFNINDVNNDVNNVVNNDPNIDLIKNTENIWYMNGLGSEHNRKNKEFISGFTNWELLIENNFVVTGNSYGRNKLNKKLKKNDLILWYMQGKGYVAILKFTGDIEILKKYDDILNIKLNNNLLYGKTIPAHECINLGDEDNKKKYMWWKIPVEFIIHVDKNKCITKEDINYSKEDWMGGFQGCCAVKPKGDWKNMVLKIYGKMKELKD